MRISNKKKTLRLNINIIPVAVPPKKEMLNKNKKKGGKSRGRHTYIISINLFFVIS